MKTVAVIPAFNEEKTVRRVVEQVKQHVGCVVVVDDKSTDSTESEIRLAGGVYYYNFGKRGAGSSIIQGINIALSIKAVDAIVLLDADGQHDTNDIPAMLSLLKDFDMVVTSRFMDNAAFTKMPTYRKFGIWMITFAYNFGAKFKVRDSQCGLRAFRANVLRDMNLQENGFGYSTEMLVKARAKGYKIIEIPTVVHYHADFKQNSSMNPVWHGLGVLLCTIRWRIKCEIFGLR